MPTFKDPISTSSPFLTRVTLSAGMKLPVLKDLLAHFASVQHVEIANVMRIEGIEPCGLFDYVYPIEDMHYLADSEECDTVLRAYSGSRADPLRRYTSALVVFSLAPAWWSTCARFPSWQIYGRTETRLTRGLWTCPCSAP